MDETFWMTLLDELRVPNDIQRLWYSHPEKFMRSELLIHLNDYGLDLKFAELVTYFTRYISQKELLDLYIM